MMHELKKQREDKMTELFNRCGVFFAFSDKQFEESKTPLSDGDEYIIICSGGYMPKSKTEEYIKGNEEIDQWFNSQTMQSAETIKKHIIYELYNHECFYTGNISDVLCFLPYKKELILKIYYEELKNQD
jgi:hypothetical protein